MMYLEPNRALPQAFGRIHDIVLVRHRGSHGCTVDRIADDLIRAGRDPGEALHARRSRPTPSPSICCTRAAARACEQQYVCQKDGVVVERDEMVKGYEFAKDQYVTFTPEEIKALEEVGTHSVDISEFVPVESIDPVYFDKTYYLAPDKGAAKPYALLTEALKETKRCAVGHWAARGKAYIVVLRPIGDVLAMQQLHFAADVRPASEIEVPKPEVKPAELKLAQQLIEQQTAETFEPDRLHGRAAGAHPGGDREEGRGSGDLRVRDRARRRAARSST